MKPDPSKYRIVAATTLFGVLAGLGIVLLGLIGALYLWVDRYNRQLALPGVDTDDVSMTPIIVTVYANAVLFAIPALFLLWYAHKSWRLATFPPPGTWILETQRIHLGSAAKMRAFLVLVVGVCCLSAAAAWAALAASLGQAVQP